MLGSLHNLPMFIGGEPDHSERSANGGDERVDDERTFAGSADPGHHDQLGRGEPQSDILQIAVTNMRSRTIGEEKR